MSPTHLYLCQRFALAVKRTSYSQTMLSLIPLRHYVLLRKELRHL